MTLQKEADAVATVNTTVPPVAVAVSGTSGLPTFPSVGAEVQVIVCAVNAGGELLPPPQAVISNTDAIALTERMMDCLMFFKGCLRVL